MVLPRPRPLPTGRLPRAPPPFSRSYDTRERLTSSYGYLSNLLRVFDNVKLSTGLALKGKFNIWEKNYDPIPKDRLQFSSSYVVESEQAVVAADDGRCSEIGLLILEKGGHVVDATIATALCLGVVSPVSSGIGGGAFMVVLSSSGPGALSIDMRETAPQAASQNMYEHNAEAKVRGALSMGVPSEIPGLHAAWLKFGKLPWKTLFEPATKLAKQGFEVGPYVGRCIANQANKIMKDPGLSKIYAPNGKLLKAGDTCYNVELGNSLQAVAEQGAQAFYNGSVGERLIQDVRKAGRILTMPPPSSGIVGLSLVLNILNGYGSTEAAKGPLGLHRLIEVLKYMFAIRMNLGEPDFKNINKTVSVSFAKSIREKIFDTTTFPPEYYMHRWSQLSNHGTSHFCVVDSDRNVVSMTTTANSQFRVGVLSPSTGIVLHNELDYLSIPTGIWHDKLPPAPTNFIKPNKRLLSSMTPIVWPCHWVRHNHTRPPGPKTLPPGPHWKNVVKMTVPSKKGSCTIYFVGTVHFYEECVQQVKRVVNYLEPEALFLEVSTFTALKVTEGRTNEFQAAYEASLKFGSKVILGDLPDVEVRSQIKKRVDNMSKEEFYAYCIKIEQHIRKNAQERPLTPEECYMIPYDKVWGKRSVNPLFQEFYIDMRDRHMATQLLGVTREHNLIVAIIGKAHMVGIMKHIREDVARERKDT